MSERRVSSKCSGSATQTAVSGEASLTAMEMPLDQAAAAAGNHDSVEAHAERFRLAHQFEADRALAGDDGRIVEGRHQDHALFDVRANHRHAIFAETVERNHFRTHFPDIANLDRRRIGGHGDDRLDAEHRRRRSDPLSVIARREGDDAAAALLRR